MALKPMSQEEKQFIERIAQKVLLGTYLNQK
jgi:hypothetical protein